MIERLESERRNEVWKKKGSDSDLLCLVSLKGDEKQQTELRKTYPNVYKTFPYRYITVINYHMLVKNSNHR